MSAHALRRWSRCVLVLLLTLGVSAGTASTAGATPAGAAPAAAAASDDVAGLVDIGGGRRLYPLDRCATGSPERVAGQVRHHFTAVEVRVGSLAVTAVAADGGVLDRTVIRR